MRAVIVAFVLSISALAQAANPLPFASAEVNQSLLSLKSQMLAQPNAQLRLGLLSGYQDHLLDFIRHRADHKNTAEFTALNTFSNNLDSITINRVNAQSCAAAHSEIVLLNLPHADGDQSVAAPADAATKNSLLVLGWICGDPAAHN